MVDERKPSPASLGQATGFLRVTLLRGPRRLRSSFPLFGFSSALPGSFSQSSLLVSNPLTRKTGTHTKWLLQKRLSWGVGGEGVKEGVCCPGFLQGGSSERPGTRTPSTEPWPGWGYAFALLVPSPGSGMGEAAQHQTFHLTSQFPPRTEEFEARCVAIS